MFTLQGDIMVIDEISTLRIERDHWKKIAETMADLNAFCYKTTRELEIQSAINIIESNEILIDVE